MEVIGFDADEISAMLEMLAAILNLGNIKFESYSLKNGTDACKLSDDREGKLTSNHKTFMKLSTIHTSSCKLCL